jgi:arsenite methyltransferase
MLARANANKEKSNAINVSFIESRITEIALQGSMADCIISNCVVNLVPEPEKQLVFNEMFRLLKPGGRIAISDILIKEDLTPEMGMDIALYVGCIAGASQVSQYEAYLREAGFEDILIIDSNHDLNVYKNTNRDGMTAGSCCYGEGVDGACQESAFCCKGDMPNENVIKSFNKKYEDININQWAGKSTMNICLLLGC